MGELDCDIILFKSPPLECSIFVTNVPTDTTDSELQEVFSQCGLVNDIHKFNPDTLKRKSESAVPTTCVSVKYYTKHAARKATAELDQYLFGGIPCKILASKQTKDFTRELPFPKAVDVCNRFFGFNKWSSRIISMTKIEPEKEEELGEGQIRCYFECEVQISLKGGQTANGLGHGRFTGKNAPKVYEVARKTALTDARKKAFAKIAIMVLTTGKVDVHVMEEKKPPEPEQEEEGMSILKTLRVPVLNGP